MDIPTLKIGDIIVPVNPERIRATKNRATKNEDVDGVGETSHHNGTKLERIDIENLLLPRDEDWTLDFGRWVRPETVLSYFKELVDTGRAVRVVFTDSNIDGFYTLDEFSLEIRGGEPGDYYVSITLVEDRGGEIGEQGPCEVTPQGDVIQPAPSDPKPVYLPPEPVYLPGHDAPFRGINKR